ncbi:anhydro-N-acetylmuramic acid kinase [Rhizobium sp. Leaf384]|uniref:anhydro-N-acetylmuramic acid kinase n=1 Tax=unclassified Rhizobium TaxID=2613769 RepID=UPI00071443B5|nr:MULTISPECIES: anhydro-N-acetylmuramic acid kinase [unclassified Rhizobium]KQS79574.1 anhydro-N-acetylmuramic acid kinase [Rhizobium sp. Leaf384]KQS82987.1 anhydro-N-acetylmuramic acid kinase [Rhizobium sp. Leaf383]
MAMVKTAIGLMSGTSMDGIDIALLETDGEAVVRRGPSHGLSYDTGFRDRLKAALVMAQTIRQREERPGDLARIERDLTLLHAVAVHDFLHANGLKAGDIDVIGFHGQTILHRPDAGLTVQIGDGTLLAAETGIDVVHDMRAADMVAGGQGAPLIPVYHRALAANLASDLEKPVVFVNIGGISNVTYVGEDGDLCAFDSGPGNMLIDQWVEAHGGGTFDTGGAIAASGAIVPDLVARYLNHAFFKDNRRRSLDRGDFAPPAMGEVSLADGARTLAHVTGAAILTCARHLPVAPKTYIVSGGGRLNPAIMNDFAALAAARDARVLSSDMVGLDGGAMEAEAWAYLAVRSLRGLPLTFPGTTGVRAAVSGGVLSTMDGVRDPA